MIQTQQFPIKSPRAVARIRRMLAQAREIIAALENECEQTAELMGLPPSANGWRTEDGQMLVGQVEFPDQPQKEEQ